MIKTAGELVVSDQLLNEIEQAFTGDRLEVGERARLITAMIEVALRIASAADRRANAEDLLTHGISPDHIRKAASLLTGEAT